MESEANKLARMEDNLHRRIVGQEDAVHCVADAIRRNRAGITSTRRPIGSFLFLGPSGVGKTELARALAAFLLDDETRIVRLDMSEYMERHEVSKMIGAPPGYIGYGEGGQLTEKVRRNPYTVVLLDEVEKAHPDVFNMLLQILEDGQLTDAQGRTVSFRNTILIGTSNLGTEALSPDKRPIGFIQSETPGYRGSEDTGDARGQEVLQTGVPQSPGRHHRVPLSGKGTRAADRADVRRGTDPAYAATQDRTGGRARRDRQTGPGWFDPVYGARPLRREVERQIENPLAMRIVKGECPDGSRVRIALKDAGVVFKIR